MAWFKVDDGFHSSRKVLSIPKRTRYAAVGLWTIAGAWCADELTDGIVPEYMLKEWGATPAIVQSLVDSGLWERAQGSLAFRNWAEYQPSKQDVDAERAASRARMASMRAARRQGKPRKQAAEEEVFGRTVTNGSENVRNPDPTRPDPTSNSKELLKRPSPATRGSRLPEGWMPKRETILQMQQEAPGVNLEAEHVIFTDYWISTAGAKGVKTNWDSVWKNWMRRKQGDTRPAASNRAPASTGRISPMEKARQVADELRAMEARDAN